MQRKLVVSSSPFLRNTPVTTRRLMLDVVIALLPTAVAALWFFGLPALSVIALCVGSAVGSEWIYERITGQRSTISDFSAVVTGLLLAFNLPANAPWWLCLVGSALAIVLVKQIFGGLGQNFMNPALTARTILMLSWAGLMAASVLPTPGALFGMAPAVHADAVSSASKLVDSVSSATPLAANAPSYSLWTLFSGNTPGMIGETCSLTLLLGAAYLLIRRVINWRIPLFFIGSVFVLFWLQTGVIYSVESGSQNALYQLLSGGLLLGAFFMATDYVTSPLTNTGKIIMGVGCGVIVFVIRAYNASYSEGCSYAILFMNILTPLIDRFTKPKSFGRKEADALAKAKKLAEASVAKEGEA